MDAKKLIAQGRLREAIDLIEEELEKKGGVSDNLLFIKSELAELNQNILRRQISTEEANIARARIKQSLFDIIDGKDAQGRLRQLKKLANGGQKPRALIFGPMILMALLLAYFLFSGNNGADNTSAASVDKAQEEPAPSLDDQVAELVLGDFTHIYPKYRDVYLRGLEANRGEVRQSSKVLIKRLKLIEDDQLEIYSVIYKHIGLALCFKVLALTSNINEDMILYSSQMLENLSKAEKAIKSISDIKDLEYREELNNWIIEQKHDIRIKVNRFIGSAINLKAGGSMYKEEVKKQLKKLEEDNILKDNNYDSYPIVIWAKDTLK